MARKVYEELESFVEAPQRLRARALFGVVVAGIAFGVVAFLFTK